MVLRDGVGSFKREYPFRVSSLRCREEIPLESKAVQGNCVGCKKQKPMRVGEGPRWQERKWRNGEAHVEHEACAVKSDHTGLCIAFSPYGSDYEGLDVSVLLCF